MAHGVCMAAWWHLAPGVCRDEDLRADRQPEFTQLDMEVAFMDDVKLQTLMEGLIMRVFQEVRGRSTQAGSMQRAAFPHSCGWHAHACMLQWH